MLYESDRGSVTDTSQGKIRRSSDAKLSNSGVLDRESATTRELNLLSRRVVTAKPRPLLTTK